MLAGPDLLGSDGGCRAGLQACRELGEKGHTVIDRTTLRNSFEFVVVAGARARQLMRGALPRVASDKKPIKVAQIEVVTRKVEKIDDTPTK